MDMHCTWILVLLFSSHSSPFLFDRSSTRAPIPSTPSRSTTTASTKNVCTLPDNRRQSVSGGCNFNNGTCGYDFPSDLWSVETSTAGAIMFGKVDDDNNGSEQKFALFTTNDVRVPLNTSRSIITQLLFHQNVCLRFWYLIPNQNSELKVYVLSDNQTSFLIGDTNHRPSQQWKKVEVPIRTQKPFKVAFKSTKENNYSYVGLDSISFDIERFLPSPDTTAAAPTTSKIFTSTDDNTLQTTEALDKSTLTPTSILSRSKQTTYCQCVCPTAPTAFKCRPRTSPINMKTTTGHPPYSSQTCQTNPNATLHFNGSCDFNKDVCGYTVPSYPHLWEVTSRRYNYGNPNVGEIMGDHSSDSSGRYMVFNTNNEHVQIGASGEITSLPMYANGNTCLGFWYNMPNKLAALHVYLVESDDRHHLLWTGTGPSNGWHKANIQIHYSGTFKVTFKSWKNAKEGFLALDDVVLSSSDYYSKASTTRAPTQYRNTQHTTKRVTDVCNCACPTVAPENCSTHGNQVTTDPFCSSENILTNASCNFDEGPCDFMIPMYPHLWDVTRYGYGNKDVGFIDGDHTSGGEEGMYAVFNTYNMHVQPGVQEEMMSQTIPPNVTICLLFWYNMPTNEATLNIYRRYTDKSLADVLLWKRSLLKTNGWVEGSVIVQSDRPFQIVFSSTKSGLESYFGIDDIVIHYS